MREDLAIELEVAAFIGDPVLQLAAEERHLLAETGRTDDDLGGDRLTVAEHCSGLAVEGRQAGDLGVAHDPEFPGLGLLEEALGDQGHGRAGDALEAAVGHQAQLLELELLGGHVLDAAEHLVTHNLAAPVQELLEALESLILEEALAHPGQHQVLEVEHAHQHPRHLPQQLPGDDRRAARALRQRHGDIAGRLAIADHHEVLPAHRVEVVDIARRADLPAGGLELLAARPVGDERHREDAVGDDEEVEFVRTLATGWLPLLVDRARGHRPSHTVPHDLLVGVHDFGVEAQVGIEADHGGVPLQISLHLRTARPLGIALGHLQVGEIVGALVVLGAQPGITPGAAPHAADVGALLEDGHVVTEFPQVLARGQAGEPGPDDCNPHIVLTRSAWEWRARPVPGPWRNSRRRRPSRHRSRPMPGRRPGTRRRGPPRSDPPRVR